MNILQIATAFVASALVVACQADQKESTETPKTETKAEVPAELKVRMKTSMGDIVLLLDGKKAPITVDNFKKYVESKHYDGTVFHRVMDGFMIQGGGFAMKDGIPTEKPSRPTIKNEGKNGLKNVRGSIAMARRNDPDSASAQFFINVVDNQALDFPNNGGYAVFGKVIEGMDVVDKIKSVPTGRSTLAMLHPSSGQEMKAPAGDVPETPVVIESVTIVP